MTLLFFWHPASPAGPQPEPEPEPEVRVLPGDGGAWPHISEIRRRRALDNEDDEIAAAVAAFLTMVNR